MSDEIKSLDALKDAVGELPAADVSAAEVVSAAITREPQRDELPDRPPRS